jgi:DNA-binding GntR family transcriptional regulator
MALDTFKQAPPLYQQVYERVRNSILTGELRPGSKVVVTKLAEEMQISRTPLREALRQLQQEGLLIQGQTCSIVVSLNQKDFEELSMCRLILEKEIIKMVVHEISDENLKEAEQFVHEAKKALSNQQQLEVLQLNAKFHQVLINACPNKQLVELLNQVRSKLLLYRANILKKEKINLETLNEHLSILEALKDRDEERAVQEIEQHSMNDQLRGNEFFNQKEE